MFVVTVTQHYSSQLPSSLELVLSNLLNSTLIGREGVSSPTYIFTEVWYCGFVSLWFLSVIGKYYWCFLAQSHLNFHINTNNQVIIAISVQQMQQNWSERSVCAQMFCMRWWTYWPLNLALFFYFFLLLLPSTYFSPRRGLPTILNFCLPF